MSSALQLQKEDAKLMLAAQAHIGSKNQNPNMARYIWRRRKDGVHIINIGKTWEKIVLAARVMVAIENPEDVIVISGVPAGQRAVFKFALYTGASYIGSRYTPGTFTNQSQKRFLEPRLLIVTDPIADHQPIKEASYMNIPTISLTNTDADLSLIDIAIPCNTSSNETIALMYWFLAREVLRIRGELPRTQPWSVMVDLFIHKDLEAAAAKEEAAKAAETEKAATSTSEAVATTETTEEVPAETNWTASAQAGAF